MICKIYGIERKKNESRSHD